MDRFGWDIGLGSGHGRARRPGPSSRGGVAWSRQSSAGWKETGGRKRAVEPGSGSNGKVGPRVSRTGC